MSNQQTNALKLVFFFSRLHAATGTGPFLTVICEQGLGNGPVYVLVAISTIKKFDLGP